VCGCPNQQIHNELDAAPPPALRKVFDLPYEIKKVFFSAPPERLGLSGGAEEVG
jgi:hypothetical protein